MIRSEHSLYVEGPMFKRIVKCFVPVLLLLAAWSFALARSDEGTLDLRGKNVFKFTSLEDFERGDRTDLVFNGTGDGALALSDGALRGSFVTVPCLLDSFDHMVGTWNAAIPAGTSVEVKARSLLGEDWGDWFSWGKFGFSIRRSCSNSDAVDEFLPELPDTKDAVVQFMVLLSRDDPSCPSPILRQITFSTKGRSAQIAYAEDEPETIPPFVRIPAPGYSQMIRDREIGDSICSPTTMTVLLNSRDPSLDLLPEEYALSEYDFNYGFGNWAFTVSGAGCYGFEAYAQYADKDILLKELANGRSVGLSLHYSINPAQPDYLTGAYGSTPGHLIPVIGYEYEDEIMDDEHLYFWAADPFAGRDETVFRRYRWTQLRNCWTGGLMYLVSGSPEEGEHTPVLRRPCVLEEAGEDLWYLSVDGDRIDLKSFTQMKKRMLGRGVIAYTISGKEAGELIDGDRSDFYPERIRVTANRTFIYQGIGASTDGKLRFNVQKALLANDVPSGESRIITIFVIANNGVMYTASLEAIAS